MNIITEVYTEVQGLYKATGTLYKLPCWLPRVCLLSHARTSRMSARAV